MLGTTSNYHAIRHSKIKPTHTMSINKSAILLALRASAPATATKAEVKKATELVVQAVAAQTDSAITEAVKHVNWTSVTEFTVKTPRRKGTKVGDVKRYLTGNLLDSHKEVYRSNKDALKARGYTLRKPKGGEWQARIAITPKNEALVASLAGANGIAL
jgi:hypothetical protein